MSFFQFLIEKKIDIAEIFDLKPANTKYIQDAA